jgi:hypothetical protein
MIDISFVDEDYINHSAEKINLWVNEVSDEFSKSPSFEKLNAVEKECCFFLLGIFFKYSYSYSYCLVGPGKLNKEVINEMMLDVIPRNISAKLSTFEAFAPVMENFLSWCEDKKYMIDTKNIREYIHEISVKMINRANNPEYWGMAKSLMMGGFSFPNWDDAEDNEPHHYLEKTETYRRDHDKIGRNDACSCGSGKKYKKCCLLTVNS